MSGSFLDDIPIGQTVPGDSPVHKAWVPGKALLFTAVGVATFFLQSASAFMALGIFLSALAQTSRIGIRRLWRSLRPVYLLAFFSILAWAFINHDGAGPLSPTFSWEGLRTGGLYAARLVIITLLTTLFFLTTNSQESIRFGITALSPLRLMGIDRHELSLLVHLAYRFVPLLRREIEEVKAGRKARNLPPPKGFFPKISEATDSLVFLFVGALRRAETTSYSLEDRGVLAHWSQPSDSKRSSGLGGFSLAGLFALTGLLLWKDAALL